MRKDPTKFRERFLRWKKGELVYENGLALPAYEDGKDTNNVPSYTTSIDDREQPGYRKYLWELSKARRNAFLKEYGDAAPIKNYYEDFLSNSGGTFNYRRWYNLASPAERKYGLEKGLAHWRDADGKTSLHPSFSIESPYSGYKNPYNPKGITVGEWIDDDHYEFSDSQINNDWPINKTLDEFDWSRKEEGSNTYGYYKGGIMLHEPTIIGKMPKYKDGLTPLRKSEVNTNLATYNPEEDLYTNRYTLPEVTITGDKKKVGTGMGKRLYMRPWKTVGDLSREQHEEEEIVKKLFGDQQLYDVITKDLRKPLSPVDPVGEFVVGNAVLGPAFNHIGKGLGRIKNVVKSGTKPKQKDLVWDAKQMFKDGNNHNYTQEDVDILNSFIPEYKEIERASKANGTYLKMPDGSTWKGDPREWVISKSKNVQDNYGPEILTHGNSESWATNGGEDVTGDVLGKKILWTNTNPHVGGTYGNNIYRFVIPKNADIQTIADAQGRFWREVKPGMNTDMLVYPNLTEDNVIRINNIVDRGPSDFFYKLWPTPYPKEEILDYYRRVFAGDDLVLGKNVKRKALLGNNGRFDINNPNIFKVLLPVGIGGTIYGVSQSQKHEGGLKQLTF